MRRLICQWYGRGRDATLRALPIALGVLRVTGGGVEVGPVADLRLVAAAGIWARGEAEDLERFAAAFERAATDAGVAVARAQYQDAVGGAP